MSERARLIAEAVQRMHASSLKILLQQRFNFCGHQSACHDSPGARGSERLKHRPRARREMQSGDKQAIVRLWANSRHGANSQAGEIATVPPGTHEEDCAVGRRSSLKCRAERDHPAWHQRCRDFPCVAAEDRRRIVSDGGRVERSLERLELAGCGRPQNAVAAVSRADNQIRPVAE